MEISTLRNQISHNKNGYTLIEILITLTIVALLFGFGYASFRDFSRRQALSNAVSAVQGDLRIAQGDAATGQKPADHSCDFPKTLDGYSFVIFPPSEYKIEANCVMGINITTTVVKDVTLDSSLTLSNPGTLQFKVLDQGTTAATSNWVLTLTQAGTSNTATVTVTMGGDIQ